MLRRSEFPDHPYYDALRAAHEAYETEVSAAKMRKRDAENAAGRDFRKEVAAARAKEDRAIEAARKLRPPIGEMPRNIGKGRPRRPRDATSDAAA